VALKRIGIHVENTQRSTLKAVGRKLTQLMCDYSIARKRTSTYGTSLLDRVHPDDGLLHPQFHQLGIGDSWTEEDHRTQMIATGRYSSDFHCLPRPEKVYERVTNEETLQMLREVLREKGWDQQVEELEH
jgi:hypothetical protein